MPYASPSFTYTTPQGTSSFNSNFTIPTFQDVTGTSLPDLSTLINNLAMQRAAQAGQIQSGLLGQQIAGQESLQAPPLKEQGREFDVGTSLTQRQLSDAERSDAFNRFLQSMQMFGGFGGGGAPGSGMAGSPITAASASRTGRTLGATADPSLLAYNYGTGKYGPIQSGI